MSNSSLLAILLALYSLAGLISCSNSANVVHTKEQFDAAVAGLSPGEEIVLANGIWEDVELTFVAHGTEEMPIVLRAQDKGKVFLEGQSNLKISGEHLHVEGLVFRNGYTPSNEVISFRSSEDELANNSRVTECVIDNYNNPERFESDYWVGIYGKNNRFDHNYLTGKRNQGVTLAVRLNTEASRENDHLIDHNYFGRRPVLGSNGGETLRIGTSHYSLTNSNTVVEYNYFSHCSGEHEIISNKSCQNIFRNNTFYECEGTLTMRHGNETLVEENFFFGNRKANTGGVRIINETQTVRNNYFEGLTGYRFRGALVIMNGVPNSPLNRYFQVKDSEASNNTFIDCDYIQLCAGSDQERSAIPVNTAFADNVIYHPTRKDIFTVYDNIDGISFRNNILSPGIVPPSFGGKPLADGSFRHQEITLSSDPAGIKVLKFEGSSGLQGIPERATPENTGVDWYPRNEGEKTFGLGSVLPVPPGENTILTAVNHSKPGDVLQLQEGSYTCSKAIDLRWPLSIRGQTDGKPLITFQRSSLFNIEDGGALSLESLEISGAECDDKPNNAVIRTSRYSMLHNYKLLINDCDIRDLDVNHSFNLLQSFKGTFADSIVLRNSTFQNITGHVLSLDKETDDIGIYNAENVIMEHCDFRDVQGTALNLHRGGRDESTFGPMLQAIGNSFANVGYGSRNKAKASISLHGVQISRIHNNKFQNCEPLRLHLVVGDPITTIRDCAFINTPEVVSNSTDFERSNLTFE